LLKKYQKVVATIPHKNVETKLEISPFPPLAAVLNLYNWLCLPRRHQSTSTQHCKGGGWGAFPVIKRQI